MEEIWKDIKGYEGYYQVSTLGNIRSIDRTVKQPHCKDPNKFQYNHYKGQLLKCHKINSGYLVISLTKNHKAKKFLVHRLVAETFLEPKLGKQVNHKDENKLNNVLSNLEWCTPSYNTTYKDKHIKTGLKNSKPVYQYDENKKLINAFKSCKQASEIIKVPRKKIYTACETKKTFNNFVWSYEKLDK